MKIKDMSDNIRRIHDFKQLIRGTFGQPRKDVYVADTGGYISCIVQELSSVAKIKFIHRGYNIVLIRGVRV